jgi:hypothetical protein
MVRKTYTPEQIINKLREAEIHLSQGATIAETSRKLGITEQTYYRWRKEYGGLRVEQAKKLKSLEKENARPAFRIFQGLINYLWYFNLLTGEQLRFVIPYKYSVKYPSPFPDTLSLWLKAA